MSNNLNWVGNKVLNTNNAPRQNSRSAYDMSPNMRYGVPDPPKDQSSGTAVTPVAPGMTSAAVTPAAPGMTSASVQPAPPRTSATPTPGVTLPSAAGTTASGSPGVSATPSVPFQQGFPPATERGYIPYYLANNMGKNVRAEFIIGSNQYSDKTGRLIEVGINYFVLEDINSRTHIMCDMYSLKFLIVLQDNTQHLF
ncbi:hypothetical protein SDC9_47625 [bioreactor metagenome]|uniref:Uncharacterized protein n=1 Tax=bioreactor metagenome TaxID=1076179 RepID=A0A644WC33_9ZZZZ